MKYELSISIYSMACCEASHVDCNIWQFPEIGVQASAITVHLVGGKVQMPGESNCYINSNMFLKISSCLGGFIDCIKCVFHDLYAFN